MVNITLSIPEELRGKMNEHSEIRWSEVVRKALAEKVEELELVEKIVSEGKLKEDATEYLSAQARGKEAETTTLQEIKRKIRKIKPQLRKKYAVKEIGVFGSYARGEQTKDSDIDVLVGFSKPVSLLKLSSLENFLGDILGVRVDMVPKKDVRPELRKGILSEAVYV